MDLDNLRKWLDTYFYKWMNKAFIICFVLLAILKAMDICFYHHWGIIPCIGIAILIYIVLYAFYRLCLFVAKRTTYAYVKVYKDKIVSQIERDAIDKYIEEHPIKLIEPEPVEETTEPIVPPMMKEMNEANELKNSVQNMTAFMAVCQRERKAMEIEQEQEEAIKLERILAYTRKKFMSYGFTDEELYQLNECVKFFATYKKPLRTMAINIKKKSFNQAELKNFSWNIANQYDIKPPATAEFAQFTFREWFANSEPTTIEKTLRNTKSTYKIEIDANI